MEDDRIDREEWTDNFTGLERTPSENNNIDLKRKLKESYEERLVLLDQIVNLRLEKRILAEDVPKMKQLLTSLSQELSEHKRQLDFAYQEIERRNGEIEAEREQNRKLESQIRRMRRSALKKTQNKSTQRLLNTSVEREDKKRTEELELELDDEKKKNGVLKKRLKKAYSVSRKLRNELSSAPSDLKQQQLRFRIGELETRVEEMQSKTGEITSINVQLVAENDELKRIQEEKDKARDKIEQISTINSSVLEEKELLLKRVENLKELEKTFSATLSKKSVENTSLVKENKELLLKQRVVQYKNYLLNSRLTLLENERQKMSQMRFHEERFCIIQRKNESLRKENEEVKEKNAHFLERMNENEIEITQMRSRIVELEEKLSRFDYMYGYNSKVKPVVLERMRTREVIERMRRIEGFGKRKKWKSKNV